ncbi:hypothetical protein BDQ12DRAFT_673224 [Crucibulum laeve]|uniref:Queuosine 5'-phosphate N-glycosylase/hydrolase n=1 Tax=Crucibulum laeve TaxID=68775 RepID=A0A5C3MGM0_9AGAR|nr:hypothetical protein BDQ12DRAFT_673224 [Crucibulum laeve]
MSEQPALPPSGAYLPSIRDSSRAVRQAANISITPAAIERLLFSPAFVDSYKRVSAYHGLALPLKFSSVLDELNLISVLSLLNFASGYRVPLHVQTGRGAWDSIRALVFSMYITSSIEDDLLSAVGMKSIQDAKIAELMNVQLHVERPHETISGVVVGELGGPLYDMVKLVTGVLNETGAILSNSGYPNLGAFVAEALNEGAKAGTGKGSDFLMEFVVERLVRAFPAFRDMGLVDGKPIYCFKKALFLLHAISVRFGTTTSHPLFPIPSTKSSPVFTDNVLPSLLIHLGVIDLSSSKLFSLFPAAGSEERLKELLGPSPSTDKDAKKTMPKEGPVLTSQQSYILRAAAIDACELIVETARSAARPESSRARELGWIRDITLPDLDMWIWSVAKDRPDYRALERFVRLDTVFF